MHTKQYLLFHAQICTFWYFCTYRFRGVITSDPGLMKILQPIWRTNSQVVRYLHLDLGNLYFHFVRHFGRHFLQYVMWSSTVSKIYHSQASIACSTYEKVQYCMCTENMSEFSRVWVLSFTNVALCDFIELICDLNYQTASSTDALMAEWVQHKTGNLRRARIQIHFLRKL